MNRLLAREHYLAARRARLLQKSTSERARLSGALAGFGRSLDGADRAWRVGRWVGSNAGWISLGVGALMLFRRPRGLMKAAARAWALWRSWRALAGRP